MVHHKCILSLLVHKLQFRSQIYPVCTLPHAWADCLQCRLSATESTHIHIYERHEMIWVHRCKDITILRLNSSLVMSETNDITTRVFFLPQRIFLPFSLPQSTLSLLCLMLCCMLFSVFFSAFIYRAMYKHHKHSGFSRVHKQFACSICICTFTFRRHSWIITYSR